MAEANSYRLQLRATKNTSDERPEPATHSVNGASRPPYEQARTADVRAIVDLPPLDQASSSRPPFLQWLLSCTGCRYNGAVKVGNRLTLVLLLALTPVVAIYTYWSATRSTRTYIDDLKRETRATSRALVPALENDLRTREWDQIDDVLKRMSVEGTLGALFSPQGGMVYAAANFPAGLVPSTEKIGLSGSRGSVEFEAGADGRRWFCRLSVLSISAHHHWPYC